MATENRYKIRLKDTKFPSGSSTTTAYLYPVAPIDGLVESADNPVNAYNVVTINDGVASRSIGRIKAQYLDIMLNDTGYATGNYHINNNYLNFITTVTINGVATQKISNNYLNIWSTTEGTTEHPQIDKQYLPGYVDDVIDVQVLESGYPPQPEEGQTGLFIRKEGTVYTFMTWNTSTQTWVPGGGELGKIYVDAASGSGDIFRAVESGGVVSTQAVLISSSPLNIMSTNTNGVYLYKDGNNNVYAKADQANGGLYRFGTVVTATGEENYNDLLNVQQLSVFSIVPNVEYVKALVSHASITLHAGNAIDATLLAGSTVSCLTAGPAQPGVVRTVATISASATYDSDQVPDAGAVATFVSTSLTDYQPKLTEGNGIDITGTVISAVVTSDPWMSCTAAGITVLAATGSRKGVVRTVTELNANYASDAAVAAHPEGVVSFVKTMLENMTYAAPQTWVSVKNPTITYNTNTHVLSISGGSITVAVATTGTEGVVKLSDNIAGTETAGSTVAATPYAVNQAISGATTAVMSVVNGKQDKLSAGRAIVSAELAGGTVTVQEAETSKPGVVVLADSLGQGTYAAHVVPTPEAVESYVTTEMAKKQGAFQIASGITSSYNATTSVTTLMADVQADSWMKLDANGIGVSSATDGTTGVVTLYEEIDITQTAAALKKAVPSVYGVTAYVGGVQTTLESEISDLDTGKMDKFTLGNGLTSNVVATTGTTVSAKVKASEAWMELDANGIGVSSATVDAKVGVVSVKGTVDTTAPWTTAVPTVSAVKTYVDIAVGKKQDTFLLGYGITSSPNAITGATVYAKVHADDWMQLDANGIGVQAAYVDNGTMHAGVVKVADLVVSGSTNTYSENTVPNVSAMFDFVAEALPQTYTSGTTLLTGGTVTAVVDSTNYAWMKLTANGIGVASAVANGSQGVVSMTSSFTSGNSTVHNKVPTIGAVVNYVSSSLPSAYVGSSGVNITGNTAKAVVDSTNYAWMHLDANGIGVTGATVDGVGGVVVVGGTVTASTGYGTAVPTVSAVKDYVDVASGNLRTDVDKKQGAFQIASGITSSVNAQTGIVTMTAAVQADAWMKLDANGIGVSSAAANGSVGVVSMTSAFTSADSTTHTKTPTVGAVVNYVDTKITGAALTYTAGVKKTGSVVSADLVASTLTSGNIVLNNNQMYVRDATSDNRGAVMINGQQYLHMAYTGENDPTAPTVRAMQNWLVHPRGSNRTPQFVDPPDANWDSPWLVVGEGLKVYNGAVAYDVTASTVTLTPVSINLTSAKQTDLGGVYVEPYIDMNSSYRLPAVPWVGAVQQFVSNYVETHAPMPGTATTASSGVVTLADSVTSTTTAVLPTGAAIVNYVGAQITSSAYSLPDATTQSKGGVYLIDSVTNISGNTLATGAAIITYVGNQITSAKPTYTSGVTSTTTNGVTSVYANLLTTDVVSANITLSGGAKLYAATANTSRTGAVRIISGGNILIEGNGSGGISVRNATTALDGTVKLASTIGTSPSTSDVPPASVVSEYVDGALLGYLSYELL